MFSKLAALPRPRALAICAAPAVALLAVTALAPLPFAVAQPGMTADVLGSQDGSEVITIKGEEPRKTTGELRMTTIEATGPQTPVRIGQVVDGWFRSDQAVMPVDAVYPSGDTPKEIQQYNRDQMVQSQNVAVEAALKQLGRKPGSVDVRLELADVGGPSAGLLFSLGIVDKLDGDGSGGDLTGGRSIAGTGTITADGQVGAVGGVSLKTRAASRDGATVFLVPKAECGDAQAELPSGMRLIPVTTLNGAIDSLRALERGGKVPSC